MDLGKQQKTFDSVVVDKSALDYRQEGNFHWGPGMITTVILAALLLVAGAAVVVKKSGAAEGGDKKADSK